MSKRTSDTAPSETNDPRYDNDDDNNNRIHVRLCVSLVATGAGRREPRAFHRRGCAVRVTIVTILRVGVFGCKHARVARLTGEKRFTTRHDPSLLLAVYGALECYADGCPRVFKRRRLWKKRRGKKGEKKSRKR